MAYHSEEYVGYAASPAGSAAMDMAKRNNNTKHPTSATQSLPFCNGSSLGNNTTLSATPPSICQTLPQCAGMAPATSCAHYIARGANARNGETYSGTTISTATAGSQRQDYTTKVRYGFFYVFLDIAAHTSVVMVGPQDFFTSLTMCHHHSQPGGRVALSSTFITTNSKLTLLILAWCPLPHADSYNEQRTKQLHMHTDRESHFGPPPSWHQYDIRHSCGPWGDLGPMLEMLLYGSFPCQVNYMQLIARHRTHITSTKEAIMTARSISKVQAHYSRRLSMDGGNNTVIAGLA
eukprot:scaffold80826_cov61-Attheya_sp.AAC.2